MQIFVRAKVGSKKEFVRKVDANHFFVSVVARPIKGKANAAIIEALAQYFRVSKSKIILDKGLSSKEKIFEVLSD